MQWIRMQCCYCLSTVCLKVSLTCCVSQVSINKHHNQSTTAGQICAESQLILCQVCKHCLNLKDIICCFDYSMIIRYSLCFRIDGLGKLAPNKVWTKPLGIDNKYTIRISSTSSTNLCRYWMLNYQYWGLDHHLQHIQILCSFAKRWHFTHNRGANLRLSPRPHLIINWGAKSRLRCKTLF